MPRTKPELVIAILGSIDPWDGKTDLQPFVNLANMYVNKVVSLGGISRIGPLADDGTATGDAGQVETMLAAGLYKRTADQQAHSSNAGRSSATLRGKPDENSYLLTAFDMDYSRILKPLWEGRIAGTRWLGKVPSQQIPYSQRS